MSLETKRKKVTVPAIINMKQAGEKVTMLTAYDALMAEIIDLAGTDIILVGDSGGMVMGGKENTLTVTMEEMLFYTKSVSRGVENALLVADMPFLSYQISTEKAIENAGRFLQEACAEAVKIEGGAVMADTVSKLTSIGIPVMGHLGLTPQSVHQLGGYKLQGTKQTTAETIIHDARLLEEAGAFSIVLEKIPAKLAKEISESITIPTIGIGAGVGCDGQVLVTQDMLGIFRKFKPKFVRRYAELGDEIENKCRKYIEDVKNGQFPNENESY
jgi:3-methyl-2-oxobutanoate hydroxymethyltransferase